MNTTLMSRLDAKPPTEAQMKLSIAQVLSLPFAYNAPVIVLKFEVDDSNTITGYFRDAARPRVFEFEIDGDEVSFKPYTRAKRGDSIDVQTWEDFSAGFTYRIDAATKKRKEKPTCNPAVSYSCGRSCISLNKTCRVKPPNDAISEQRMNKLSDDTEDFQKAQKETIPKQDQPSTTTKKKTKKVPSLIGDGTHEAVPRNAQEYYDAMIKKGSNITIEDASRTVKTIKEWTGSGSTTIRQLQQQGKFSQEAEDIDNFIKNSTPYKGEIYRGIKFDNEAKAMEWLKGKEGDGILDNQSAHASWTSKFDKAELYAGSDPDYAEFITFQPVIIKTKNKTGASINNLSLHQDESEVIVSKNTRHKVEKFRKENGAIIVETEEIEENSMEAGTSKKDKDKIAKLDNAESKQTKTIKEKKERATRFVANGPKDW